MKTIKIKLFHKLFGAFFLTSLLIVILMIAILQFNVSGSFTEYTNKLEMEKHQVIVDALEEYYQNNQSWEAFLGKHLCWHEIMKAGVLKDEHVKPLTNKENPLSERSREGFSPRMGRRLSLIDAQKNLIVGNAYETDQLLLKAISVEDKTVGWLGLRKKTQLSDPLAVSFLKYQNRTIYITGVLILLLGMVIAFLLSRHLLSPVKLLTSGARAIASRKFETLIRVDTSDELGDLASAFNKMAQTLKKFDEQQKQWISDISHELGTPLSILRGEIEAMQDGIRDMTIQNLDSLHSEVISLSKLVGDLRELSLAETGGLSFKKTQINPLKIADNTLSNFKPRFSEKGIRIDNNLDSNGAVHIYADPYRLRQVVSNLMENTLRYVQAPGLLKAWHHVTDKSVTLHFADNGKGVPEQSIPRLFDRFYRVEPSRNRVKGGSGLGLAICRHIVEAHKGKIKAANVQSGGLQIEIEFPLTKGRIVKTG